MSGKSFSLNPLNSLVVHCSRHKMEEVPFGDAREPTSASNTLIDEKKEFTTFSTARVVEAVVSFASSFSLWHGMTSFLLFVFTGSCSVFYLTRGQHFLVFRLLSTTWPARSSSSVMVVEAVVSFASLEGNISFTGGGFLLFIFSWLSMIWQTFLPNQRWWSPWCLLPR